MVNLWDACWHALAFSECICRLYHGDVKNIFVVDINNLRERGKSLGEVEIGVLRGLISELSPVWIGLGDRRHTGWRRVEMALE